MKETLLFSAPILTIFLRNKLWSEGQKPNKCYKMNMSAYGSTGIFISKDTISFWLYAVILPL